MTYTWTAIPSGQPLPDPYADWDRTVRATAGAPPSNCWQPVYVALAPLPGQTPASAAQTLLAAEQAGAADLRFHEDTARTLHLIAGHAASVMADIAPQHHRFFIFRPEDAAAVASPYPIRVLQVGPAISFTTATAAQSTLLPASPAPLAIPAGQVLTAVIDDQIGFANDRFQLPDGTTRIARLWLQDMPFQRSNGAAPGRQVIGREMDRHQINSLLATYGSEDAIYRRIFADDAPITAPTAQSALRVRQTNLMDPSHIRPYAFQAGHGTHVLDLAAGWPRHRAPADRPIVAVQLPTLATAETWGARLNVFILMAVIRILHWADTPVHGTPLPVVINLSYGISAGPKDGTGFLEAEVARLVSLRNATTPTVVVLPSGNSYRAHLHASMTLTAPRSQSVMQRVQPADMSVTFTEIWVDDDAGVTLRIAPPVGPASPAIPLSRDGVFDWQRNGTTIGRIYVQQRVGARRQVTFALCPTQNHEDAGHTAPAGGYDLTLTKRGSGTTKAAIDVQRDDTPSSFPQFGRQAYLDDAFVGAPDPETYDLARPDPAQSCVRWDGTLSAYATAQMTAVIVVGGAYDRHAFGQAALYSASGEGLPRGGPDLAAICEDSRSHPGSLATGLFSGSASLFSGTSMAAPRVTRAIVDSLAAGTPATPQTLVAAPALPVSDARIGAGILPFRTEPDRPARRVRG